MQRKRGALFVFNEVTLTSVIDTRASKCLETMPEQEEREMLVAAMRSTDDEPTVKRQGITSVEAALDEEDVEVSSLKVQSSATNSPSWIFTRVSQFVANSLPNRRLMFDKRTDSEAVMI